MSKSEELKRTDGKFDERKGANKVGSAINDVEGNEHPDGYIFSSKEQDWADEHAHGFFGRIAKFLVSWGVESRGMRTKSVTGINDAITPLRNIPRTAGTTR